MSKRFLCTMMLLVCGMVSAQGRPKAGQTFQQLSCDLNGDGKTERIGLVAYGFGEIGFFGRLKVWDSKGRLLWQAPPVKTPDEPFAFGRWEYGSSTLEYAGDLDGDGQVELISAKPQSDVRPTVFKRFRWNGSGFVALPPRLLLESSPASGNFVWTAPFTWDGEKALTWVTSLEGKAPTAHLLGSRPGGVILDGEARMQGNAQGLSVASWIKKL